MKKFNYKQFKIGDFVEVKKLVQRNGREVGYVKRWGIPDGDKIFSNGSKTLVGVIVGVKQMQLGTTDWEEDCGVYFCGTGSVTVWRVRFALAGKEWCALPEDLEACICDKFPVAFSPGITDRYRESCREQVKDAPRDDKGRWT